MNKDIFLSNSLGNKKEKFVPINENKIAIKFTKLKFLFSARIIPPNP